MNSPYYGMFVQDTWRAASNLTLNFGLRFEYEGGIKEADDRWLTEFDPPPPSPSPTWPRRRMPATRFPRFR